MKIIKLTNTETNEILQQMEVSDEQLAIERPMWEMQVQLHELDGIKSRFDVIDPNATVEPLIN